MVTILLIEDNEEMRENTAEILELAEYQVITAGNGREGIQLAELARPDLIISDVTMPVLDGFDMLKELRKSVKVRRTPFIFLTARTEKTYQKTGKDLGANAYLVKPYDGNELLKIVAEKLNKLN